MPIDPLPTPPSTGDPENFDSRADAFLGALPDFQSQANALESNVETLEGNATTAAQSASDDADATASDRVQTGEDRDATAADRVQTGNDRDAVDAKYTEFDARWLGPKSADPTTDNEGEPLIDGAAYFNTESDPPQIRQYDLATDSWVAAAFPSKASESQAETGTDDTAYMTALKSYQQSNSELTDTFYKNNLTFPSADSSVEQVIKLLDVSSLGMVAGTIVSGRQVSSPERFAGIINFTAIVDDTGSISAYCQAQVSSAQPASIKMVTFEEGGNTYLGIEVSGLNGGRYPYDFVFTGVTTNNNPDFECFELTNITNLTDVDPDGNQVIFSGNQRDELPLGVGQEWQGVTGSRTHSTVYTNSTGRTIKVNIVTADTKRDIQVSSDGSTWITVAQSNGTNARTTNGFEVPRDWSYRIDGSLSIKEWAELR